MEAPADRDDVVDAGTPVDGPDYRFLLANERTFLAYLRTALALDGAGLAVDQLVDLGRGARVTLGVGCALLGLLVAGESYLRWRSNDRAIRTGTRPRQPRAFLMLSAGLVALSVAAIVLIVTG